MKGLRVTVLLGILFASALVGAATGMSPASNGIITRVSTGHFGTEADGRSLDPSISADGRYIAFTSHASNLVPNDTNGVPDVFVYDRRFGAMERITMAPSGQEHVHERYCPSISGDGRYVSFLASDYQMYVYDRVAGERSLVSATPQGAAGNYSSRQSVISQNGRFVVFDSGASNLVRDDTNNNTDVFVRDLQDGVTTRVSVSSSGGQANAASEYPSISADGRYVTFHSSATNLVSDPGTGYRYLHDRESQQTVRVPSESWSGIPRISRDGRWVAYMYYWSNGSESVELRLGLYDTQTGVDGYIVLGVSNSREMDGRPPSLSSDGRFIAFDSRFSTLVAEDGNAVRDVFVFDRVSEVVRRVSLGFSASEPNGESSQVSISADGRTVAFLSHANNLVPGDTNAVADVFVYDGTDYAHSVSVPLVRR